MATWSRRVLLVDDDPLVASLIEALLTAEGFQVVTCASATAAREQLQTFDPDLAILDVNLGEGPTGLQLGYVINRLHPDVALMYLTRYPTALLTNSAMADHVAQHTVLAKDDVTDTSVLLRGIEDALRGRDARSATAVSGDDAVTRLTGTQLEVLRLVSEGMTNAAIAAKRHTSERAVEKQLKSIYDTLGVAAGRDQNARVLSAMKYAQAMGNTVHEARSTSSA